MYVLAAKDFALDVVDSLASGNSPWENHPTRRILREIWNCLTEQLRDLETVVAEERRVEGKAGTKGRQGANCSGRLSAA